MNVCVNEKVTQLEQLPGITGINSLEFSGFLFNFMNAARVFFFLYSCHCSHLFSDGLKCTTDPTAAGLTFFIFTAVPLKQQKAVTFFSTQFVSIYHLGFR